MVVALPELGAIASLAACCFLLMLYYAYGYSLGALMQLLAKMFRGLTIHLWLVGNVGFGFVGDALDGLDSSIRHYMGVGISETLAGWHYFLHVSAYTLTKMADIVDGAFHDTYGALTTLRRVTIPNLLHARVAPIWDRIARLEAQIASLPHDARVVVNRPVKVIEQKVDAVAAYAGGFALPRLGSIPREVDTLKAKVGTLEKALGAVAVGTIAGVLLGKLGMGWLRCSNVSKVAKSLCRLDTALLDALLLGTAVIVSSVSLVEWAELMLSVEDELVAGITGGFRELRGIEG